MSENNVMEKIIRSYEEWHPAFFEHSVNMVMNGAYSIVVELDDNSKIEYNARDNTIRDVTHIYNRNPGERLEEESWRKEFGHQLRRAMTDAGITQDQLSEETGISRQMLSRYIHGTSTPSGYILSRLSEVLNCDVHRLTRFGCTEKL